MRKSLLFLLIFLMIAPSIASAATRYVRKTGTNSGTCTAGAPCLTINYALGQMAAGDSLVIGNGTYAESIAGGAIKNGSAGAYTVVKAENTGGMVLTGYITVTGSYIQVEGMKVNANGSGNNGTAIWAYGANHVKFVRMAAYGSPSSGNVTVVDATSSSYILFEDCWSWGTGRYKFIAYQSNNVIFRRCVARHDYHNYTDYGNQSANFVSYDSTNTQFQNVIAIDSSSTPQAYGTLWGAFWLERNANTVTTGAIKGSIILNVEPIFGTISDPKRSGAFTISNTVIWNSKSGYSGGDGTQVGGNVTLTNMTIGNIWGTRQGGSVADWDTAGWGVGIEATLHGDTVSTQNSIFDNVHSWAFGQQATTNWNYFYRNGANIGGTPIPSLGANDVTNVDPRTSSLRYLPRIEASTTLKTAGVSGTQIGAEIMYQHGVSGTLYGETGYDTLTSVPLWPWPNEALIKADFASYSGPGPSGVRGFATGTSKDGTAQSLTKYIWEYLGNTIPSEIYGAAGKTPKPPTILGIQ